MAVISLELLLHGEDLLVALVQPLRQRDHDVPLLEEEVLVAVHLRLVLLHVLPLLLELPEPLLVLAADAPLLLLEEAAEGRHVLDLVAADQELALHAVDPLLEVPLLFLLHHELPATLLEGRYRRQLVGLCALLLLLKLQEPPLVHQVLRRTTGRTTFLRNWSLPQDRLQRSRYLLFKGDHKWIPHLAALRELRPKAPELLLVFLQERALIHVLVDGRDVADVLRAVGELERRERLRKRLERRGDHAHHRRLAIASEAVLEDTRELGVAVGDVLAGLGLGQGANDVAESAQRLIDLLRFLEALARGARDVDTLAS